MFRENSTVCFLGDSITSNGRWIYEAYDFFKEEKLKFFNCGKSGINAFHTLERIDEGCLIHCPDYVVIMLGMNDINRGLYSPNCTALDKEEQKQEFLNTYRKSMREIYNVCKNFGAEVILCTPTPYDDSNMVDTDNDFCNPGLVKACEIVKELADEKGCKFIDFFTPMKALIGKEEFVWQDRVHPNPHGEHIMSQIFLKEIGKINKMNFDGKYEFSKELNELLEVSDILRGIAFTELESDIFDALSKKLTIEDRKNIIRQKQDAYEDKTEYIPKMYQVYMDSIDFKIDYQALYIKKMRDFLNS